MRVGRAAGRGIEGVEKKMDVIERVTIGGTKSKGFDVLALECTQVSERSF